jgi:hypothetical protein
MQLFEALNDDNFIMFAMKNYDSPSCIDIDEFNEDLLRFKYLKRLLNRYNNGDLQERLILNHLIVLFNVFGVKAANKMVLYKIDKRYWPALKPFLVYLGYIKDGDMVDVPMDMHIVEVLRNF